jgi:Di-haem oxidoreductase, putative peroxidase
MKCHTILALAVCFAVLAAAPGLLLAQHDPGPRAGAPSAGGPYPTLSPQEVDLFNQSILRFEEVASVSGSIAGEDDGGLGPTFNGNSCAMCHAQPFVGGSSPGLASPQSPTPNPQVALATLHNAANTVPSFITPDGPVREARFVRNRDGSADGGVHGLFTIAGRDDAPGCTLGQPDFAHQLALDNVIFRIPTPVFGLGLVENTPDATLQDNLASTRNTRRRFGIAGTFNTSGNDGTITRFGWKAQNKSLLVFAGEAYNVEQGVTNELFPNKRSGVVGCVFNPLPEDTSSAAELSDTVSFAAFMRLSAPPAPAPQTASTQRGSTLFSAIGCALCHSPSLTTGPSPFTGMGEVTYHPYSDFALHHMGSDLADGVSQGAAGGDQFRTAPLWGVGQRLFFMHDGRTSDLLQAVQDHADCGSAPSAGRPGSSHGPFHNCSSEANQVVRSFNALSPSQQQDILNFLRSL